jgi:2-keto-4-pentenoate hydratase/2-oxohepta-3-ene-1,7-dioic acid hydratase in catechol pathway
MSTFNQSRSKHNSETAEDCRRQNYFKHVIDMGSKDIPSKAVIILKSWNSLSYSPQQLKPSNLFHRHLLHYEIDLEVV